MKSNKDYDVIVIGSGIGGSSIASIIAKNGFSVLSLEKGKHPRLSWGEATLPQSSFWMKFISERYDFPELKVLSDSCLISKEVSKTCGIKTSIGFAYHEEGKTHDMKTMSNQFLAPEIPFLSETHFFREDVDMYMANASKKYGVDLMENTEVIAVDIDSGGVKVKIKDGTEFKSKYIIDSSGKGSVIAKKYDLHDKPTRLKTESRCIWSHFENIKVFDEMFSKSDLPGFKHRFHDGTLHHVFDGGWFWIIPFNNHKDSTNQTVSIGLMLDCRKYPRNNSIDPETEFFSFVNKFPTVAKHLGNAKSTKGFMATDRIQYSCKNTVGERYFITPQAYGAVDALYSRGLISTFESMFVSTKIILDALKSNDFSIGRFEGLNELHRDQLDMHDRMVSIAYKSYNNYESHAAWIKVWVASKFYGDVWLFRSLMKYMSSNDKIILDKLDFHNPPFKKHLKELVDIADSAFTKAEEGLVSWEEATSLLTTALKDATWLPHGQIPLDKTDEYHFDFTPELKLPAIIFWGKTRAPEWVRKNMFDFFPTPLIKAKIKEQIGMDVHS